MHWLQHILGLDDPSGRPYLFWSGIAADVSEAFPIVGLIYVSFRRHNCEIHWCPRLARQTTAAGNRLCRKHHPDGPLTVELAHAAHEEASR